MHYSISLLRLVVIFVHQILLIKAIFHQNLYETANFLILEQNSSTVQILKSNVTIELSYKEKPLYMDARFILSTLTQRIKKFK